MPTIERVEIRRRGIFGTLVWWIFIAFNALMVLWMYFAIKGTSTQYQATTDAAAQAGTAIGGGIAVVMLLWVWIFGAIILGLIVALSRGKKVTIERTID
ncbi:MAG: hypothetical protein EOS71_00575 [Mesorhizobium sp.]|nr:hypothetical protein EOA35_00620 [Mesorhizobium sp. M8A.F.Ca.ET.023.01.1.1]RWC77773.1 MAG: hypothetical protein EOS71_00575 [Mesorhizobium sp.]TIS98766.1 MAG: hypothetical protein E5W88_05055 [Mesorhizobium sp.]TIW88069.1 MAG: hypothetical protein E5V51_09095 [Mesorhizobium sp.]